MIITKTSYMSLIALAVVIALIVGAFFYGSKQGKDAVTIQNYETQVKAYETTFERSLTSFEAALEVQRADYQAALQATEDRLLARQNAQVTTQQLKQAIQENDIYKNCVADQKTVDLINKNLRGGQ